jgi:hypothetical protein
MSSDYKYEMQMIAEEEAFEKYGKDFYSLSWDQREELYLKAEGKWFDRQCSRADRANKEEKESK